MIRTRESENEKVFGCRRGGSRRKGKGDRRPSEGRRGPTCNEVAPSPFLVRCPSTLSFGLDTVALVPGEPLLAAGHRGQVDRGTDDGQRSGHFRH
jgi:hypothetical protein